MISSSRNRLILVLLGTATACLLASTSIVASAAPAGSRSGSADPWAKQANGLFRANQVIEECLVAAGEGPDLPRYSCIRAAYKVCEREHGTSQRDISECAAISRSAWEARIASMISRFLSAKSAETRLRASTEEAKQQLVSSQRRWKEWSVADCEIQAKGTENGSTHSFSKSICQSDHAAMRAIDLQRLIDWWLG